jgi:hypothetical protein
MGPFVMMTVDTQGHGDVLLKHVIPAVEPLQ